MTLSLVDAAGALRDAISKHDNLSNEMNALSNRVLQLEEDVMHARRAITEAKEQLVQAATADKVMIL